MYQLSINADQFVNEFKEQLLLFEKCTGESISIAEQYTEDKIINKIHKEQLEEQDLTYWRLLTKLDTFKKLFIIPKEEYKEMEILLNQSLSNIVEMYKIIK